MNTKSILVAATALSAAFHCYAAAVPGSAPVYGCLLSEPYSLISLPTNGETTSVTTVAVDEDFNANGGGVCDGSMYYSINYFNFGTVTFASIKKFDPVTWEYKGLKNGNVTIVSTDMTYDPVSGKIYGCFKDNSGTGYVFGTLTPEESSRDAIKTLDKPWNACAAAKDGTLYAIDSEGTLHTVNKATGDMTAIGPTGVTPANIASATIDQRSGRFYWTASPAEANPGLYEVDPTTGAATLLYELPAGKNISGLYIPVPDADADAPEAATGLTAVFDKGSLTGSLKFTVPAVSFGGSPLSGEINYSVTANGPETVTAGGKAPAGETVSVPLTLTRPGSYDFTVLLSNAAGTGPASTFTAYIGPGTPAQVKISSLKFSDGTATLSWEPVTTSADGGYFDPDAVSYTVRRYPDGETVMSGGNKTEYIEKFDDGELTVRHYTVTAECAGVSSEPAQSALFITGAASVPYTESFETADALAAFTVVDGNKDRTVWDFYEQRVRMKYNMRMAMDDWLITPPVRLRKGWTYRFSFAAAAHNETDPERLEVKFGNAPEAAAMTTTLIEPTVISGRNAAVCEGFASVLEDGLYYFGIHGISDADKYYLYIDDISVTESFSNEVPDVPAAFTVSPRTSGEAIADIAVTAPSQTISGESLGSLSALVIERDGTVIKTFAPIAPGQQADYTDKEVTEGPHTYAAYAVNESGEGKRTVTTVYVGVNVPSAPRSARVVETAIPGEVTISWEAPDTDIEGNPINPGLISYRIVTQDDDDNVITVADDITGTSYTYQAIPADGKQDFVAYAVHAKTSAGESEDFARTDMIFAGPDYTLPFAESFPGAHLGDYVFGINKINGIYAGWALSDELSQDGDGGCIGFLAQYPGDEASLYTGKISLAGTKAPVLQFHYFASANSTSTLRILADGYNGEGYVPLRSIGMDESGRNGWVKATVALDAFKGGKVSVMFDAIAGNTNAVAIDNIRVIDRPSHDLVAADISSPYKVKAGTGLDVTVTVENFGAEKADNYTVLLFCNGTAVDELDGTPLESGSTADFTFTYPVSAVAPASLVFRAEVEYAADENPGDNSSGETTCAVERPNYPAAGQLAAETGYNGVVLSWSAPDMSKLTAEPVTEDFESYPSWATTNVGQWLLVDRDGCRTAGIVDEIRGQTISFFVFDNSNKDKTDYSAHSGNKMMGSAYLIDEKGTKCDDWMISPLLPGHAQTISFYARSQRDTYPESFEVLYSTGSTNPDDFVPLDTYTAIPAEWQKYTADLPDGALRFAIRGISDDCYLLLVDDVTFIPADAKPVELNVLGYNVYRDGQLITPVPVAGTTFTDTSAAEGEHEYMVTVVYDRGESAPSNAVTAGTSSIAAVGTEAVVITAAEGIIAVRNAAGLAVNVFTTDGKTIFSTEGSECTVIHAAPGLYIVLAGNTTAKVIVR